MIDAFIKKFNKAKFSESMKKTLENMASFSLKVDKVNERIAIEADFDAYVDPLDFTEIENEIKTSYAISCVRFFPHYRGVEFRESYMDSVIEMLKRNSDINSGFFDNSVYCYRKDERVFDIKLRHMIDADLTVASGAEKFIEDCILDQFGIKLKVNLIGEEIDASEYVPDGIEDLSKKVIENMQKVQSERRDSSFSEGDLSPSLFNTYETDKAEYFEQDGRKLVKSGNITLDITDPQPIMGKRKKWSLTPISHLKSDEAACIGGRLFLVESKENYDGDKITYTLYVTDNNASVTVRFTAPKDDAPSIPKAPAYILVSGHVDHRKIFDREEKRYKDDKELTVNANAIYSCTVVHRQDKAEEKRVELHLHTEMSALDALGSAGDYIKRAAEWGMPAVAFTDHGTLQSYPMVMSAAKKYPSVKPIYGIEGYLVDDTARAVFRYDDSKDLSFADDDFIIFDIETTGLSQKNCGITQIGAIRQRNGETIDTFDTFVNPAMPIPEEITKITGITDEMVADAPSEKDAVKAFLDFAKDSMLVAHNANFDVSFISRVARDNGLKFENPYLDTVALSRYINNDISRHKLDNLAKYYKLGEFDHHRAFDDTEMLAKIFVCMVQKLAANGIFTISEMNDAMAEHADPKKLKTYHVVILVKTAVGLKNLYKIVSRSYIDYFYKHPRIPKTLLNQYREGLVVGSACAAGELYSAVLEGKSFSDLLKIADFYDYLEVQPNSNNGFLIEENRFRTSKEESISQLCDNVRKIIAVADKQHKPVVATGDVHFMDPEDEIYRQIMMFGMKFQDAFRNTLLYFKTTDEMLAEFSYLGEEKAREIVIDNPKKIIADFEDIKPIPDGTYTPKIDGAEEELQDICRKTAFEMYGDPLPDIVKNRMEKELNSVIEHGYAVLYVIARRLVRNSEEHGYLVGSRGSVGSSFIATLAKISEVNPLPPHYLCPKCKHSEFITDGSVGSGFDLPDKVCEKCGTLMRGDGHDIPFETFLGFHGEKAPDIDLNFSGFVQSEAHKYTEVLFGKENIFRAGTVGTLQDKNCFGFVKKFLEEKNINLTKAEQARLAYGFVGVKRTTGQHPGGIVVIPKEYDIYDFTPVQYPANKASSGVITTHFAFEYLHDTLLKLDILGHDVPTFYKVLEEYTGIDVRTIKVNDKKVLSLFESTEALGITPEQIGCKIGTYGLPEFGTDYAIQMIIDAKPKTFADLLQISGLSHGTGIWLGNGKELIESGTCTIDEIIGTRDSIMLYLIKKGLDSAVAFKSMERTRKGRGLEPEQEEEMRKHDVPEWYIASCNKIKYMFPKAHAAAYTIASLRLGWFKVYKPIAFYATYFTVKADNFDGELVMGGSDKIHKKLEEIRSMPNPSAKDEDTEVFLKVVIEMYARGIGFLPVSIMKSEATAFVPENGKIRLPLCSLNGLGVSVAEKIVEVVRSGEATTIEEIRVKASVNKSIMEILEKNDCFGDMPKSDQITMF